MTRTLIIGGGVVGVSTAYFLARRGEQVVLIDDGDGTTSVSTGNAGIIAPGHPPIPQPGLIIQTIKWMFDSSSPLHVPIRFDPELAMWMFRFALACRTAPFERSMRVLSALGRPALECIRQLIDQEDIPCNYRPDGFMDVYLTERGLKHGADEAARLAHAGYTVNVLDSAQTRRREPSLVETVAGCVEYTDGCSLEPGRFLRALAERAVASGTEVRSNTRIERLLLDGAAVCGAVTGDGEEITADRVVLCAGAWSTVLARTIGVRVPLQGGKGYHVHVPMTDPPLTTACVCMERHVAMTPMGERIRLAGTVELSGLNTQLHQRRIDMLSEAAQCYLPAITGVATADPWCGLRPCTADGLPVVGPCRKRPNLFLATGHAKLGLTLGPLCGRLLSEWMLDGAPSLPIPELTPDRF